MWYKRVVSLYSPFYHSFIFPKSVSSEEISVCYRITYRLFYSLNTDERTIVLMRYLVLLSYIIFLLLSPWSKMTLTITNHGLFRSFTAHVEEMRKTKWHFTNLAVPSRFCTQILLSWDLSLRVLAKKKFMQTSAKVNEFSKSS